MTYPVAMPEQRGWKSLRRMKMWRLSSWSLQLPSFVRHELLAGGSGPTLGEEVARSSLVYRRDYQATMFLSWFASTEQPVKTHNFTVGTATRSRHLDSTPLMGLLWSLVAVPCTAPYSSQHNTKTS
jgi:cytochrome c biogenesis protein CcdA